MVTLRDVESAVRLGFAVAAAFLAAWVAALELARVLLRPRTPQPPLEAW